MRCSFGSRTSRSFASASLFLVEIVFEVIVGFKLGVVD